MDRIRLKRWGKLDFRDPKPFLTALRRFEREVAASPTPDRIKQLRSNGLKAERELRDGAIFALGMSEVLGRPVLIAPEEEEDFDFVATWIDQDSIQHLCRIQLKEVVPQHLNATASLQQVISGLSRYADASDLTVAIKFNRLGRFDPAEVRIPDGLVLGALWVYGALTEDQAKFALWGDFARGGGEGEVVGRCFDYPTDSES